MTTAPLLIMLLVSSLGERLGRVLQESAGVPGALVRVGLDLRDQDPVLDHRREREKASGAVPTGGPWIVDKPLRASGRWRAPPPT